MNSKSILISCVFIVMLFFNGCSSKEINDLSVAISMGIDKTENGYIVTEQIINPRGIASKRFINEPSVLLFSQEGNDILEILRKMSTTSPRRIYNSHLRIVIFGETLAKEGISDFIDFLIRNREMRTDFYFAVAKESTAKDVLSVLTRPVAIPGIQMFDALKMSEKFWAPTKTIRIVELANSLLADGENPTITGIEITGGKIITNTTDALKVSDLENLLELSEMGVFKKDKLVGWLKESEGKGYNLIRNNVKSSVAYNDYNGIKISVEIINAKSKIKAFMINGKPTINVEINEEYNVSAVTKDFDVSKEENKEILNQLEEKRIGNLCNEALIKAKDLNADIFGFGEEIHRSYPNVWKELKNNWNEEFVNLPIKVTVNSKIKDLGEITKPLFSKEEE